MTYGEKARELKDTLNCGQSVVVALDELTGLDESTAKALSTGLGGGLRCGEACGAYCGAVLAIGLTVGKDGMGKPGGPWPRRSRRSRTSSRRNSAPFAARTCSARAAATTAYVTISAPGARTKAAEVIGK